MTDKPTTKKNDPAGPGTEDHYSSGEPIDPDAPVAPKPQPGEEPKPQDHYSS